MMKNYLLLILGVIVIVFAACSGSDNLQNSAAELVPESATAVVSFDLESLLKKANMEEVKQMEFYKDAVADAAREGGEVAAKVLENPENSGIDLSEKMYFFADIKDKKEGLVGFVFQIADAKKLENLVLEGEGEIEKIKGLNYFKGADGFTVAWKEQVGFMGTALNEKALQTAVLNVFNKKSSIGNNSKAAEALSKSGDITYYFSTEILTKIFENELTMSELFVGPNYFKDNHLWGSTSFEKGKIESTSSASLSKELNADLKMIFADGSETDFSRFIPKEKLMMSMTGKLNMRGINQLLKDKSLNGLLNRNLNKFGLSADDIAEAIDGDMVLAVNKLDDKREPSVLFGIKIGDREKLVEILGKGETLGILVKKDENTYRFGGYGNPEGQIIIKDDLMFFSNNLPLLAKLEKGKLEKSESIDNATYAAINGVLGVYVNYEPIFEMMESIGDLQFGSNNMKEAIAKFDWGTSTSTIKMQDDSKNALQLIIESTNQQYSDMKKREAEWEKRWEEMEKEELELEM